MSYYANFTSLPPEEQQRILDGAAIPPPPGVQPNFVDPANQNTLAHAIIGLCLGLATIAYALRIYARQWCLRVVLLQDYLGFAAFGLYIGCVYVNYWLLFNVGYFVHTWNVQAKDITPIRYIGHVGTNLYAVCVTLLKLAIIVEWIHIFVADRTRSRFFWACVAVGALNVLWYTSTRFAENLSCHPFEKIWNKFIAGGNCADWTIPFLVSGAVNLISDVTLFILPQRAIWSLAISSKKKQLGFSLVFACGLICIASAAVRLAAAVNYMNSSDTVYSSALLNLWAGAELTCGVLVFCIPALPKAFQGRRKTRLEAIAGSWAARWSTSSKRFRRRQLNLPSTQIDASDGVSISAVPSWKSISEEGSTRKLQDVGGKV